MANITIEIICNASTNAASCCGDNSCGIEEYAAINAANEIAL